jgi:hypothetical protein
MADNYACADPYRAAVLDEAAERIIKGDGVSTDVDTAEPELPRSSSTVNRSALGGHRHRHLRQAAHSPRLAVISVAAFGLITALGVFGASPAHGVANVCVTRSPVQAGKVSWQLRQASGLTTVPASPGVLFTHNDRGLRDSPAPGEDTTYAAVWAITPNGTLLARFRLVDTTGAPIPYYDTEAISTDPAGRIVLADTGTNVDQRVTVALYRFTPPVVTTGQAYTALDVHAEIIPVQYVNSTGSTTPVKRNVEAFTIDPTGAAWFVPRTATLPYSYTASAAALNQAAATHNPLRAVRSTRLTVYGPMTDASISPDHTMLLVKSQTVVYAYQLAGSNVATALATNPCRVAVAADASSPGYGEAIAARDDGGFYTVKESSKTLHTGNGAPIWSFKP